MPDQPELHLRHLRHKYLKCRAKYYKLLCGGALCDKCGQKLDPDESGGCACCETCGEYPCERDEHDERV